MNSIEADNFFENEVRGRFTKWEPGEAEVSDWLFWLKGMDWGIALSAIREHKSESRYNAPALSVFRVKARGFMPPKEKTARPDDTIFVMYEGGGRGTLSSGSYFPVVVRPKEQGLIMKAAENARKYYEDCYGGIWKVYEQTTSAEMGKMRTGIRAARIDGGNY